MKNTDLSQLSTDDLRAALEQREAKERKAKERARESYEKEREAIIHTLCQDAERLESRMAEFKRVAMDAMSGLHDLMLDYGDAKRHSQGNFSIKSEDGTFKIQFSRNRIFEFDERAEAAEQHIREYLSDKVKKRDKIDFEMISTLLERDGNQKFDPRAIQKLYRFEKQIKDERFQRGCELFKEAYKEVRTATYIRFYQRQEGGKYEAINLNFSAL